MISETVRQELIRIKSEALWSRNRDEAIKIETINNLIEAQISLLAFRLDEFIDMTASKYQ